MPAITMSPAVGLQATAIILPEHCTAFSHRLGGNCRALSRPRNLPRVAIAAGQADNLGCLNCCQGRLIWRRARTHAMSGVMSRPRTDRARTRPEALEDHRLSAPLA